MTQDAFCLPGSCLHCDMNTALKQPIAAELLTQGANCPLLASASTQQHAQLTVTWELTSGLFLQPRFLPVLSPCTGGETTHEVLGNFRLQRLGT